MKKKILILTVVIIISAISGLAYESDLKQIASSSVNRMAFEILDGIEADNIFFSPYSLSTALSQALLAAEGETAQEMQKVLHHYNNSDELRKIFGSIPAEKRDVLPENPELLIHKGFELLTNNLEKRLGKDLTINIANALWADKIALPTDEYIELSKLFYDAGLERVDFVNRTEESRQKINRWVEEQTNDRIKNLLEQGSVDPLTRIVLTNAIYFLANWEEKFDPEATENNTFYGKQEREIPFMRKTKRLAYYQDDYYQAVGIPYKGRDTAMLVVLPGKDVNIEKAKNRFNYDLYEKISRKMITERIDLHLPKFKLEEKYELKSLFSRLGMRKAFTPDAEFYGLGALEQEIFIDEVIHQAYIEVDEKGTEAAAATGVTMRTTAIEPDPIVFKADRPFFFFIRDKETNLILFCGIFSRPQ